MKKYTLLFSILIFLFISCKKNPPEPELTLEQKAKQDSASNSLLINKLGTIYMKVKYPANSTNVRLASFTFGKDTLTYMGTTSAQGKITNATGYIYYNSKDNI